jgi:hypothetical protein
MKPCGKLILAAILSLLMASLVFSGCSFVKSREAAEKVVNRHFEMIATNGYEAAMADYGPQFFQKIPKDEWAKDLAKLSDKLGPYQSHYIDGWRVFQNAGSFGPGTLVSLQMQVVYSRNKAVETFTMFKGVGEPDYRITGHTINSDGLLR